MKEIDSRIASRRAQQGHAVTSSRCYLNVHALASLKFTGHEPVRKIKDLGQPHGAAWLDDMTSGAAWQGET